MEWNAFYYNSNKNKIENFNIFEHYKFCEDIKKVIKEYKTKKEFERQLEIESRYYFWSKCEWELIIKITDENRILLEPWVGCREPEKTRIDVTDDKNFNWKNFAEEHIEKQIYRNEAKIDVFDQIKYNWKDFVDYIWDNRNLF